MTTDFPPTDAALAQRLAAVSVSGYQTSRNHLEGQVTRLSPYLTHGFISLPHVAAAVSSRQSLTPEHKLFSEFAWREFYQHVQLHLGERLLTDLRPALPGVAYDPTLPDDVRHGATGVPPVDQAVRALYANGYLHNHARLWLASYMVHIRKIHWRAGADWLYAHLLDGDLASNHLSWQWVAGTFSIKPYLFNADNLARFAPADWHATGSTLDQSYAALEALARSNTRVPGPGGPGVAEPHCPPCPPCSPPTRLPDDLSEVELVHPWMLHPRPATACGLRLGVIHTPFHARHQWSSHRWAFVLARLNEVCDALFVGDLATLTPQLKDRRVHTLATFNAGYREHLSAFNPPAPERLLTWPDLLCPSFSRFWRSACPAEAMHRH